MVDDALDLEARMACRDCGDPEGRHAITGECRNHDDWTDCENPSCLAVFPLLQATYDPGTPGRWYERNGDPGDPGDPPMAYCPACEPELLYPDSPTRTTNHDVIYMPTDPSIAVTTEPNPKRKKALAKAGEEHEKGRPKAAQIRVDGEPQISEAEAWDKFKEASAEHELKKQKWEEAQKARDVRLDDLVKVHAHKPFDAGSAARVSKEAARAVKREKDTIDDKQAARKAVVAARNVLRQYIGEEQARSLLPDEE